MAFYTSFSVCVCSCAALNAAPVRLGSRNDPAVELTDTRRGHEISLALQFCSPQSPRFHFLQKRRRGGAARAVSNVKLRNFHTEINAAFRALVTRWSAVMIVVNKQHLRGGEVAQVSSFFRLGELECRQKFISLFSLCFSFYTSTTEGKKYRPAICFCFFVVFWGGFLKMITY